MTLVEQLPRLFVLSDVPVERTAGGKLLLYRLLNQYPADRLMVMTTPPATGAATADRVECLAYHEFSYRIPRLIFNRFNPFWPVVMSRYICRRVPEVMAEATKFQPTALLSVAEGYLWFVAQAVADRLKIPLHLILHDDWPAHQTHCQRDRPFVRPVAMRGCEAVFGRALRRAATRLAVSPGMSDRYRERYGVGCEVLYPSRGDDSPIPEVRVSKSTNDALVIAYAGLVYSLATLEALKSIAEVLEGDNGRLDLYTPATAEQLSSWGLSRPNVRLVGFFSADEMARRVSATATALFLPASFDSRDRIETSTLFPSKLADYTAIGLPILVWGPAESSAARWALDNPGATEIVTDSNSVALKPALARLRNPEYAAGVAAAGITAGIRDFDVQSARRKLFTTMTGNASVSARDDRT